MLILRSAEALLLVAEGWLRTAPTADKRTQPLQSLFSLLIVVTLLIIWIKNPKTLQSIYFSQGPSIVQALKITCGNSNTPHGSFAFSVESGVKHAKSKSKRHERVCSSVNCVYKWSSVPQRCKALHFWGTWRIHESFKALGTIIYTCSCCLASLAALYLSLCLVLMPSLYSISDNLKEN